MAHSHFFRLFKDYGQTQQVKSDIMFTHINHIFIYRPVVILEIGVAVLVAVFLLVYLATRYNPPKDPLFYGMISDTDLISLTLEIYSISSFLSDPQINKQQKIRNMIKSQKQTFFLSV